MANGNGRKLTAERRLTDYEYLGCRLRRHQWDEQGLFQVKEGGKKFVAMIFRCRSCKCERTDIYTFRGELDTRYYKYPQGYQIHYEEDEERITTRSVASFLIRQAAKRGDSLPELP